MSTHYAGIAAKTWCLILTTSQECIDHGKAGNTDGYAPSGDTLLHRKIFHAIYGYLPEAVMHSCDNPRCINPHHLIAGTLDANNKDRAVKGRGHPFRMDKRKLTPEQVAEIRRRYRLMRRLDPVNSVTAIAKDMGVDRNVIHLVGQYKTYQDLP